MASEAPRKLPKKISHVEYPMAPPQSTGSKPSPVAEFHRRKTRGRIDSRSSECSNKSDRTFSDVSYLDQTSSDSEEREQFQAKSEILLRLYDDYLLAKLADDKIDELIDEQIATIWTRTEGLRMRVQHEKKKNHFLKTVLKYNSESDENIANMIQMAKEMDTFLVKFDPLSQTFEKCNEHFVILGKVYNCDVIQETDTEEMAAMLKGKIADLSTLAAMNGPSEIGKLDVEAATFADCLSEMEDMITMMAKFYADLSKTVEAMQKMALQAASLSHSSLQLDEATGR